MLFSKLFKASPLDTPEELSLRKTTSSTQGRRKTAAQRRGSGSPPARDGGPPSGSGAPQRGCTREQRYSSEKKVTVVDRPPQPKREKQQALPPASHPPHCPPQPPSPKVESSKRLNPHTPPAPTSPSSVLRQPPAPRATVNRPPISSPSSITLRVNVRVAPSVHAQPRGQVQRQQLVQPP